MFPNASTTDQPRGDSPLSLRRLTDAFAVMLGRKPKLSDDAQQEAAARQVVTDAESITEALLFVGQPDNSPLSAERIAATMRDVTPEEVDQAVVALNARYESDGNPYTISRSAAGYRMVLREEFSRVREKFQGNVRQARLSPTALEVLALVAYRQPITLAAIDQARGEKSQSLVNQLVRRGLILLERPADRSPGTYSTTGRFLHVFGLDSLEQLPRIEEFDMQPIS